MNEILRSVNLSLSSSCGADCVFCPDDRGRRIAAKNMPLDAAAKIIDEAATPSFRGKYQTASFHIGENGDCFINRDAIDVLRHIKRKAPDMAVFVWTDLQTFTPEKMEIVVSERLLSTVGLNIDGATNDTFAAVKRLDMEYVREYLPFFIALQEKHQVKMPLFIISLTMRHYVDAVRSHLGRNPFRIRDEALLDTKDDFEEVAAFVQPMLKEYDSSAGRP